MVPNGWKKTFLSEVSDRIMVGLATSVTDYYVSTGVPIIRNQNIKKGYFDDAEMLYLTPEFSKKHPNKRVKAGDVITVHTGSNVGLTCVVPNEYDGAQTFTTLIVTPNKKLLESQFLNHLLNSKYGAYQATRLVVGGGKGNLNTSDFKNYPILLPPIHEQKNISQILATWDQAITVVNKLLENSRQQKKALMQQLLTGKKRLLDENGVRFSSKWPSKSLKDISKVSIGLVTTMTDHYVERGIPLIRNSDIKENRITKEKLIKLTKEFSDQNSGRKLLKGDVVTVHTGEVGVSAVIDEELNGCLGFATLNTRPNTKVIDAQFLCWYFNSSRFIAHCVSLSTGDGRQNLNLKDFSKVMIPVPSLEEQKRIATVLSIADREIEILHKELNFLKQEKKALMQQLLTGKKRVKVAA